MLVDGFLRDVVALILTRNSEAFCGDGIRDVACAHVISVFNRWRTSTRSLPTTIPMFTNSVCGSECLYCRVISGWPFEHSLQLSSLHQGH